MLNRMCKSCSRFGEDCKGTESQVWTGCVYYEKDIQKSFEVQKETALEEYKGAKQKYLSKSCEENWKIFCAKKRVCMLLGVKI